MIRFFTLVIALISVVGLCVVPSDASSVNTEPTPQAACFGNAGIQIETQDAYACEHKDADEGGSVYIWVDNEAWVYSLHADSGHFHVWLIKDRFYGTVTAAIQEPNGDCVITDAGYGKHPTTCLQNGAIHTFSTEEAQSYADLAEYLGEIIPDRGW